jgi:putative two-component system response regulator
VRVYHDKLPHEQVVRVIAGTSGTHFDPDVVAAFLEIEDEFRAITDEFAD